MKTPYLSHKFKAVFITLLFLTGFTGVAMADAISDFEDVAATAAEMQFINRVIDQVKAAVPPLDGWELTMDAHSWGGKAIKEGRTAWIMEVSRNYPFVLSMHFKFHHITSAEKKKATEEKQSAQTAETIQEEMRAAAMSGDVEKIQQLQLQLNTMLQKQMEGSVFGQAARGEPVSPAVEEKVREFQVQVTVNRGGEHIGKQFDMPMSGVTRAFRVEKNNKAYLSYKYYLGSWEVSELDRKNWRMVFPKSVQTPANHLRTLVLFTNVYGDRESVEEYVKNSLDLRGLKGVLD